MSLSPPLNTCWSKSPADHKAIWTSGPNHEIQMPFATTRANRGAPKGVTPLVTVFPSRRGSVPPANCGKTQQLHPWHDIFRKMWVTLRCPGGFLCFKLLLPCWENSRSDFSPGLSPFPHISLTTLILFCSEGSLFSTCICCQHPCEQNGAEAGCREVWHSETWGSRRDYHAPVARGT